MITEFKTDKGRFLLAKVNDDASDFYISGTGNLCAYAPIRDVVCKDFMDKDGSFSIIGLVSDLTEEQWREVVEFEKVEGYGGGFVDYEAKKEGGGIWHGFAKDSGQSLLNSLEVYSKNPYRESEADYIHLHHNGHNGGDGDYRDNTLQLSTTWRSANERTGTWLLLKKES